jgi:hypothetical protein
MVYKEPTRQEVVDKAIESKAVWMAVEAYMRGEIQSDSLAVAIQTELSNAEGSLLDELRDQVDEFIPNEGDEYLEYK